jgi:hypothetical protein
MVSGGVCMILSLYFPAHLLTIILLAIVLGGVGALWHYWRSLYVASQKEFDYIAETDYAAAQAVALDRFGLAPDELMHDEPCKFRNATTKRDIGQAFSGLRVGSDEKPRRSPHEYLVVNFGHAHLFVFRCVWDLTSGNTLWEETHEFAYRDITCVELTHKKDTIRINLKTRELLPLWKPAGIVPVNGRIQVPADESVALRLASGELVELFAWKRSSGGVPSGEGKKSYQNAVRLQKLVRELKQRRVPTEPAAASPAAAKEAPPTLRQVRES